MYIDSLQLQLAEYMATVLQGFLPMPADSCLWVEMSPGITPDHTVLINWQNHRGSMIFAGIEHVHSGDGAGRLHRVCRQSGGESRSITLIDVRAVSAYGRLILAGREMDVDEAAAAAINNQPGALSPCIVINSLVCSAGIASSYRDEFAYKTGVRIFSITFFVFALLLFYIMEITTLCRKFIAD